MTRRPPRSTLSTTLVPDTTLFRVVDAIDDKLRDHLVIDETDDEVVGVVDLVFGHIACIDRVDSPGTRMDLGGRGLCTDWRGARDGDAGRLVEGITQGHQIGRAHV